MEQVNKATCLRVYIDENAYIGSLPIYEAIVVHLKRHGLHGATVFRGVSSFGHLYQTEGNNIHGNWLKADLPILIETIGTAEKIQAVIPDIIKMMHNRGLVTRMEVDVLHQGKPSPISENASSPS